MTNEQNIKTAAFIHYPSNDLITYEFRGRDLRGKYIAINIVEHFCGVGECASLDNTEEHDDFTHSRLVEAFGHEGEVIEAMNGALANADTI